MEGIELSRRVMEALPNSFDSEGEVNNRFTPNTPSNIDKHGNVPTSAQYADQQDIALLDLQPIK